MTTTAEPTSQLPRRIKDGFSVLGVTIQRPETEGKRFRLNGHAISVPLNDISEVGITTKRLYDSLQLDYATALMVHDRGLLRLHYYRCLVMRRLFTGHVTPGGNFFADAAVKLPPRLLPSGCPQVFSLVLEPNSTATDLATFGYIDETGEFISLPTQ